MEKLFGGKEAGVYRRTFSRMGWALTALLVLQGVGQMGMATAAGWWAPGLLNAEWFYWSIFVLPTYLLAFPAALLILHTIPTAPRTAPKLLSRSSFLRVFVISLAGLYLSNLITLFFIEMIGRVRGEELVNPVSALSNLPVWLMLLIGCVLAPVAEELLFRRALLNRLKPYGEGFAIFASALLFAMLHANLFQMLYAFTAGVCFAYVALRTGAIRQTILLHALINGVSVAVPPLVRLLGGKGDVVLSAGVVGAMFCGAYLVYRYRGRLRTVPSPQGLDPVDKWGYFLVNPGMTVFSLLVVFIVWMTILLPRKG